MILKASQRGGASNLAAHLLRTDENEHVEIHELRGFCSENLEGAFQEIQAVSRATKCEQYLFSLSLNPPETENVPIEHFENAVSTIETKLGLVGQPRALVFHEKEGRRHAHCVWSRIDSETMTAKQMSFFKTKLKEVSRDLYFEHNWKMPKGLADPTLKNPKNLSLQEWQQAKRAGHDPKAFKHTIQDAWAISDSRAGFEHALNERGLWLAKGDRRGHVVLDYAGEVYSLSRSVGIKTKDIRARLGDEKNYPSVSDTQKHIADAVAPKIKEHIQSAQKNWSKLSASLAFKKSQLIAQQKAERSDLVEKQRIRSTQEANNRLKRLPSGLKGVWARITGKYALQVKQNEIEVNKSRERDQKERQTLVFKHQDDRRHLQKQIKHHRTQQASLLFSLRKDQQDLRQLSKHSPPGPKKEKRQRRTR